MKIKALWVISFLSLIITCAVIPFMPDSVPMHYSLDGQIDRWGSKYENLIFPAITLALALFWTLLIKHFYRFTRSGDGKTSSQAAANIKVLRTASIVTACLFTLFQVLILLISFKSAPLQMADLLSIIVMLLGLMIVILGNLMPKTRINGLIGLRTPWSMKSDELWAKSNRFGGISFVISGLIMILSGALLSGAAALTVSMAVLIIDCILSVTYSYVICKKAEK